MKRPVVTAYGAGAEPQRGGQALPARRRRRPSLEDAAG